MNVAILDLGTNTFHLLIADIRDRGKPRLVYTETIAVKLGEGGIGQDFISTEAYQRGINALQKFRQAIDLHDVTLIKTAATSAIRSASNGLDFVRDVNESTGIDLTVINGDEEARIIYEGVRAAVHLDKTSVIVDIGGGSVEFIICNHEHILWKQSFPIGAARLMERFHHFDPIHANEIKAIEDHISKSTIELQQQLALHTPEVMIGSAGAFETFAEFQQPDFKADFDNPELELSLDQFKKTAEFIIGSSHSQRAKSKSIAPVRVDMIVVATVLTSYLIRLTGVKDLRLSVYSLKEGILFGMLK